MIGKKFCILTIIILFISLGITSFGGYLLDPAMYYRIPKFKTYCTEQYTTAGIIKNSSAEVAIIGSSMMQNTNVNLVEDEFNLEAKRYTLSGMTIDEIVMLVNRAIRVENNVDMFIINLDISMFNSEKDNAYNRLPKYIYDENKINDIKYLLGYDVWFKFIPFNIIYNLACNIDSNITNSIEETFKNPTTVDLMGNWSSADFGENIVKDKYISGAEAVSKQNLEGMLQRMINRFDEDFYKTFEENNDKEFKFIFPPYSALMWYNAEQEGYMDILLDFKKYIVDKFEKLDNVEVYDFQDYDGITNLDNYKDTTHYISKFNDMMIKDIANNNNIINLDNVNIKINKLRSLLNEFKEKESNWLEVIKVNDD